MEFLKDTWPHLETEWQRIRPTDDKSSWDPQFRADCEQVPGLVRRQLGLYCYGVASWDVGTMSWQAIGGALAEMRGLNP